MLKHRLTTLTLLTLALLAALAAGSLQARHAFLTRGMPNGLPEPIVGGGAELGINVALEQYDDAALANALGEIEATGIQFVKQSFYFDDTFDWAASDRVITAVSNHNLTLIPLLDGSPTNSFAPPPVADFAAWATDFATRYGDQLDAYIIWDEPNLTGHWGNQPVNPFEYAALLAASADAIRTADAGARIVAAPLAPTVETGPENLADHLYLQRLYEVDAASSFDIAAAKPYGFDHPPSDRTVDPDRLNFSRVILLREVMQANGDEGKALWAGNWGWNALPPDWTGDPSVWEDNTPAEQAEWSVAALARAQAEWPWMGLMFLENWEPNAAPNDPIWGFSMAGTETAVSLAAHQQSQNHAVAQAGFHFAQPTDPAQQYEGNWEFSPEFGADIGQTADDVLFGDRVRFTFEGTEVGLRVRRANFRARLYITVNGEPANALPRDEHGTTLLLTSADPAEDYIATHVVARNLPHDTHTVEVIASRGWDQWALNGFSVGSRPSTRPLRLGQWGLGLSSLLLVISAVFTARRASWGNLAVWLREGFLRLNESAQLALTALSAFTVMLMGFLTFGGQTDGLFRRLDDVVQIGILGGITAVFYAAPSFFVYLPALLILLLLLTFRPFWGLVIIAFAFPFYFPPLPKQIGPLLFSIGEIVTLVTLVAAILHYFWWRGEVNRQSKIENRKSERGMETAVTGYGLRITDVAVLTFVLIATLSLAFTERLDVALNEWRVVIIEPAIFYGLLRWLRPSKRELHWLLDAFVLGGVVVALIGLWRYAFGVGITAEAGLLRLQSVFGSPNNVALYLGRLLPLLLAVFLLGNSRRRWLYGAALLPVGLALLLTFSKGALFLSIPAAVLFVFWQWQKAAGRPTWPWLVGTAVLGTIALLAAQQLPALAARLSITGETGIFRLNLWQASLSMIRENPLFGVGLDNFVYAYRGRYILAAAWQEPNLNHPHNIVLDLATRLGLLGLLAGGWLFFELFRHLRRALHHTKNSALFPIAVGFAGALVATLAHGLVDHSFFLIDLAFIFYLKLGTAVHLGTISKPSLS